MSYLPHVQGKNVMLKWKAAGIDLALDTPAKDMQRE